MLHIKNLTKKFPGLEKDLTAVDGLSLEVKKGQIFGFVGLNGAGKTTTIKMIGGLLFPDKGQTTWEEKDTLLPATRSKIGFMPEQPQFHRHLSANEIMYYAGELFGLSPKIIEKQTRQLLKSVGLLSSAKTPVRNFSKGMNQRLALAVSLMNRPEVIILDEPLDGLDPIGRTDFKKLILAQKKAGTTVLLSSHILSDIDEICDQIGVINKGKLIFNGTPKQLKKGKRSLEQAFVEMVS